MKILILTYGRHDRQITFNNLPPEIQAKVLFVVQDREKHLYPGKKGVLLPPGIETIGQSRQFLVERFHEPICMLDDDLEFAVRRVDDPSKFRAPEPTDILHMFDLLEAESENYRMVGVSAREGANRNTALNIEVGRQMRIHVVDPFYFRKEGIRYDRVKVMEDFDAILQVLSKGEPNLILNGWVHNQGGSNTEGGCSSYRTPEVQEESAKELAKLWPKYVQCVRKTTKESWGGGERTDVRVQWKKCYEDAQKFDQPHTGH